MRGFMKNDVGLKRDKFECFLLKYEHALSLMWILPMIVTLPFFGQPILDGQIIRNTVGIYTYLNYSLISAEF